MQTHSSVGFHIYGPRNNKNKLHFFATPNTTGHNNWKWQWMCLVSTSSTQHSMHVILFRTYAWHLNLSPSLSLSSSAVLVAGEIMNKCTNIFITFHTEPGWFECVYKPDCQSSVAGDDQFTFPFSTFECWMRLHQDLWTRITRSFRYSHHIPIYILYGIHGVCTFAPLNTSARTAPGE